ncbi:MAG: hypothetical protein U0163_21615 [Gemmatimonadaceae bacterium]
MIESTAPEVRALRIYAATVTLLLAVGVVAAFTPGAQKATFTEIDVQRINIVEPDGKLRMVLSNRPRSIGPIYKGKPFGYPGGSRPGIIFFNDEGTENGGLTFAGKQNADGTFEASSGFSFDQFNQDQILYFQYDDQNGKRRTGFTIADRANADIYDVVARLDTIRSMRDGPAKTAAMQQLEHPGGVPMFAQRVYVGRDRARAAVINLSDPEGRPRLRLLVDSTGAASLEFLDASGTVTSRYPERR